MIFCTIVNGPCFEYGTGCKIALFRSSQLHSIQREILGYYYNNIVVSRLSQYMHSVGNIAVRLYFLLLLSSGVGIRADLKKYNNRS